MHSLITPILGDAIWIGGGGLGLVLLIVIIVLVLRRERASESENPVLWCGLPASSLGGSL